MKFPRTERKRRGWTTEWVGDWAIEYSFLGKIHKILEENAVQYNEETHSVLSLEEIEEVLLAAEKVADD